MDNKVEFKFDTNTIFSSKINFVEFEYEGRKFKAKKMSAFEGVAVLKTLLTRALPIDLLSDVFAKDGLAGKLFAITDTPNKKDMSVDEFIEFQQRILRNAYEVLPAGDTPVVDKAGNFGVIDVEYNMFLVAYLLVKVIEVNYKDFFVEILQRCGMVEDAKLMTQEIITALG